MTNPPTDDRRDHDFQDGLPEDDVLVEALRAGNEAAFDALVNRYHDSMVRVARMYVADVPTAEEVVQEAWLGILRGIERFEGRSALKTWMFRIVTNRAKTRGVREKRTIAFGTLGDPGDDGGEDVERFLPDSHPEMPGGWLRPPESWDGLEDRLMLEEARTEILQAIEDLPARQRTVITLRDIDGWTSEEVRNELAISKTNQRVLLHRARVKVRRVLEEFLESKEGVAR